MKKTTNNLVLCSMIFAVSLIISNVVTTKTIDIGFNLFGTSATIPGAACCYAITFLMTDVIGEIWGKEAANKTVVFGFICQCLATLLIIFTQALPAADTSMQEAYDTLLGQSWIFFIGSMVGYFASQSWDVYFFHKIRDKYMKNHDGSTKARWIWNNASTMTSQIIDTVLFIGISFGLGFNWIFDKTMWPTLAAMLVCQYCFKFLLALIDTPIFYLLTHKQTTETE